MLAVGTIWFTNGWLTARFSENTRVRTELRSALYTGNLLSELQRTSVVPQLLARDPALISALMAKDFLARPENKGSTIVYDLRSSKALQEDMDFLTEGDVFTEDLIETYINYKYENEINPVRLRPTPQEFEMYYDC